MRNKNICPHKHLYTNIKETSFIIAKRQKEPKCLSVDEWINKIQYLCTMEYNSAIKRNKVVIHT